MHTATGRFLGFCNELQSLLMPRIKPHLSPLSSLFVKERKGMDASLMFINKQLSQTDQNKSFRDNHCSLSSFSALAFGQSILTDASPDTSVLHTIWKIPEKST